MHTTREKDVAERKSRTTAKAADAESEQQAPATSEAAPLAAPADRPVRVDARRQAAAPNAVAPHVPFKDPSVTLTDENGNELDIADVLEYPTPEKPGTLVRVNQRVYRTFTHMNAKRPSSQLMYPEGAMISIFEAERIKAEFRAAQQAAAEYTPPR